MVINKMRCHGSHQHSSSWLDVPTLRLWGYMRKDRCQPWHRSCSSWPDVHLVSKHPSVQNQIWNLTKLTGQERGYEFRHLRKKEILLLQPLWMFFLSVKLNLSRAHVPSRFLFLIFSSILIFSGAVRIFPIKCLQHGLKAHACCFISSL